MRQHMAPVEIEFRRSVHAAVRVPNRSRLHGVTRLRIPAPTTPSRAPRATTIGANVVAAVLVVIGAALAPKMPVPATVLCFTGALLILDLTGFLPIAVPARSRCKVIDLARARRARMRASVT
jgi:hypothetical protein